MEILIGLIAGAVVSTLVSLIKQRTKRESIEEMRLRCMITAMTLIPPDQWHKPGPVGPEGVRGPEGVKGPEGPQSDYSNNN